ncbi:MAG TPA: YIP1 family protein [Kofleriaceae bacterium]
MTLGDLSEVRATRPAASRIRGVLRWLAAPLKPFFVVLVPDRNVRPEVVAGRYGLPLLSVVLCACVAAFALGTRLDVGPAVRAENAGTIAPGANANAKTPEIKTDREIDKEIGQRTAMTRVKLGLGAVFATPFRVLALALAMFLLARFIGGKPTMKRAMTVASLAAVPGAVHSLMTALVAWRQPRVFPDELGSLVSFPRIIPDGHPVLARLFTGVDVFTWWSVIILAFGLCAAADFKPRKSVVAIAISFVLYLVVTRLIMGGAQPPPGVGR